MAQEFTINSTAIEDKINSLLPSQGGFGAGIDFSASTMVIPIIDLTETASGGSARADLQTALSLKVTSFSVTNATTTLVNTTGYFRVFGNCFANNNGTAEFNITDGTTTKKLVKFAAISGVDDHESSNYDFNVFLTAGDSLTCTSSSTNSVLTGCTRQIASLDGTLTNP
mgnify:FL=1|tara:strand:+ start:282 stop:788 length:507 start_codon:yes stop_codon:yes gene_type:complete